MSLKDRTDRIKEQESEWQEASGLSIANVLNHFQVVSDNKLILFISPQRHECRAAYIRGYIQGRLDGLKDEVDRRINQV